VTADEVATFERCISVGGVALFPTDTVYGLATEPESREGVDRLHRLKGRPPAQPAAVMFFRLDLALEALPELEARTRAAVERLLPAPITVVVPNPAGRFPLACGPTPDRLGIRVPDLGGALAPLAEARWPVLQSSANVHGGPDPRRPGDVPERMRSGVDVILDAGELPGVPSTVVSLGEYELGGLVEILREGAVTAADVEARLR
jgi:L-threonylcarbamoyladenylate synthase